MKSLLLGLCCAATLFAAAADVEKKAPSKRGDRSAQRARAGAKDPSARRAQMEKNFSEFRAMREKQNAKALALVESLDKSKLTSEEQKDLARYLELRKARDAKRAAQKPGEARPKMDMAEMREFGTLSRKVRAIVQKCVLLNAGLAPEKATATAAQLKDADALFSFQMPGRGFGPQGGDRAGMPPPPGGEGRRGPRHEQADK